MGHAKFLPYFAGAKRKSSPLYETILKLLKKKIPFKFKNWTCDWHLITQLSYILKTTFHCVIKMPGIVIGPQETILESRMGHKILW